MRGTTLTNWTPLAMQNLLKSLVKFHSSRSAVTTYSCPKSYGLLAPQDGTSDEHKVGASCSGKEGVVGTYCAGTAGISLSSTLRKAEA